MPLRVLHLDSGPSWRGGQRQVLLLAIGLREAGHEPLVIGAPDSALVRRARTEGVATSAIRMRADWDLRAMRRVRTLIRTWRPDVVHAHDARAHAIALGALLGHAIPLVVTRRVAFPPKGRLKYGPRVARFVAVSGAVRDALAAGGVPAARIDVVHSGVPAPAALVPRDWRAERGWPADAVVGGLVGAMTAEKGLDVLAAACARLAPEAQARLRLVLLGGADSSGAERLGGVDAWRAGFVEAIHPAMAGLDLLLHPSRSEGLGTAVIDAMALGVPPIAFAVGGLPEVIEDGHSGWLVPAGDAGALSRAMMEALGDAGARAARGAAARERAAGFSVARMVEGTLAAYGRVLSAAGRA